ncbi:MAG: hypothetical protein R2932_34590 [Caldilineaceae bacterium]
MLYLIRILELAAGLIGIIFGVGDLDFMAEALFQPRASSRGWANARRSFWGLLLTGLGDLLIPLVPQGATLPVVLAMLFAGQCIYGVGRTSFGISQVSLRQRVTPDEMQGRMNATIRFVTAALIAIGGLVSGGLGLWIGPRSTLVVAAVGEMLVALWVVGLADELIYNP